MDNPLPDHPPMSTRGYTRFRDDMRTVKARAILVVKELHFLTTCAIGALSQQRMRLP